MRTLYGIGLISATVLLFQVTLTRLFSIAQFYHFAFLVVSLALLGFGASGSLLTASNRLRAPGWRAVYVLAFGPATLLAYLVLNRWAFDSYAIAWDRAQVWRLLGNLLGLAVPFTLAGAVIGAFLADPERSAGCVYGANMIGSAVGAAAAPLLLAWVGDARLIVLCGALSGVSALLLAHEMPRARLIAGTSALVIALSIAGTIALPDVMRIKPSPYKPLSSFRRNPDATLEEPRYNAYSRLDIVHSPTIHSAPGKSIMYFNAPPPEIGLLIDGDNLLPVVQDELAPVAFAESMPANVALSQFDTPDVLVLGLGGGLDAWIALQHDANSVVGVEPNGLIVEALRNDLRDWAGLVDDPRFEVVHQEIRTYARQTDRRFDVVQIALNDANRPITSGAFTLSENYVLTVEGVRSYLDLLDDNGVLVITRWLQSPPSEDLRTLALLVEALEANGGDPQAQIVAFRSYLTVTFLVKTTPFSADDVAQIQARAGQLAYDMVLAPGLSPETVNRYAYIEGAVYHTTYMDFLTARDRAAFYDDYDFDVRPPTDDHPFFFHFFKWRQTPDILDNLGRTWQPFGGSGYFVLVALLIFALAAAAIFILLPVLLRRRFRTVMRNTSAKRSLSVVVYFAGLGLAYLLIEVAALQQFILVVGQPTLAIATVLGTLLLFSGIGSTLSERIPWTGALAVLTGLLLVWPWLLDGYATAVLPLPLALRLGLSVLVLMPLGLLMGVPFARGITAIRDAPDLVPWAWAINGGASVISAVLAALLALSFGFGWVLRTGAVLYALAWLTRPRHG
ncbi:MAG: hypothetical protein GYB65_17140 [Chloroflexi bacterium]|nr:hypothetical protein [Chloroflexota bacterium]